MPAAFASVSALRIYIFGVFCTWKHADDAWVIVALTRARLCSVHVLMVPQFPVLYRTRWLFVSLIITLLGLIFMFHSVSVPLPLSYFHVPNVFSWRRHIAPAGYHPPCLSLVTGPGLVGARTSGGDDQGAVRVESAHGPHLQPQYYLAFYV